MASPRRIPRRVRQMTASARAYLHVVIAAQLANKIRACNPVNQFYFLIGEETLATLQPDPRS